MHVIHSNITTVAAPISGATTNSSSTSFTANWTPSTTIDNTGGGLTIKHFLGYSTDPTFSTAVTWVDVSGQTSYTVTHPNDGLTYYWKILAQSYNTNTNNKVPGTESYDWFCGGQTSSNTETVNNCFAPAITVQPVGLSQCEGTNITFSVTASGTGTLSYQWGKDGSDIIGASNSAYSKNNIAAIDAGNYICKVTNSCGNMSSSIAALSVNTIPSVSSVTPGSRCDAGTVNLSAVASAGTLNWYSVSVNGTILSTGTTYNTNVISSNTTYYVDATSNGCTTPSRTAVIATVNSLPSVFSVIGGWSILYWR